MIYNLVRKGGIPVLASPASDTASQLSCCLAIKFLEARMQATISLQCSFPIHGFDDEQTFTLLYTADNMVPGNTSLKPPAASPPQDRLDEIARQGNVHLKTLSLALKAPCPVWCPPSSGPIAPKDGFSATFGQFAELASATQIHILFDWNWLHKDHHARFDLLIRHPEQLTGIPVDQSSANRYRLADWSVFSLVDDVASEAPPPYTVASKKRPRPATANSTPPLPPKRVLLSPTPFLTSPTEKATPASVSVPSPKTPLFPAPTSSSEFQDAVKNVVETLLPQMLQTILPDMLPRLSTAPSPSPSPSRSPRSSQVKAKPISSLGTFLNARATAQLEAQLREIYAETLHHATEMHNAADVEFHEILEEQKLDVAILKEDSIAELNRVFDDKLAEFRESTADMVDEMEKRVELVYADVRERLDVLVNEYPEREEGLEKKKRVPGEQRQNIVESRSRRAASLPL